MTVGEAPGMTPDIALEFIKEGDKQDLNMMFHFQHMEADCIGNACVHTGFKLKKLKKVMSTWQDKMYGVAWNANYMENHDQLLPALALSCLSIFQEHSLFLP